MYENVLFWLDRVTTVATEKQQWVALSTVTLQAAVNNIYFENWTLYYFYIDKLLSLAYFVCRSAYTYRLQIIWRLYRSYEVYTDHRKILQIIWSLSQIIRILYRSYEVFYFIWSLYRPHEVYTDHTKFIQIIWSFYRSYEVYIHHMKFTEITWSLYKSYEVYRDHMKLIQIIWSFYRSYEALFTNHMKPCLQIIWSLVYGSYEALFTDHMKPCLRIIWSLVYGSYEFWYRSYEFCRSLSYYFGSTLCHFVYGCMFCTLLFNFVNYVFLLLCMFRSRYCVSLCCFVYCFCVNVYSTAATGCQSNYS